VNGIALPRDKEIIMRNAQSTGWRALNPIVPDNSEPLTTEKKELFEAARLAGEVLNLTSKCRQILDHLVGVYGNQPIEGRILVWPSNEFLSQSTGIPDRTLRFCLRQLISLGVVCSKDSPNGKRFAQRAANGQIIRAYGFDLSPLLNQVQELRARKQALDDLKRERSLAFDELTIHRRAAQEALRAIAEHFPEQDIAELTKRAIELARVTPRRSTAGLADPFRQEWQAVREEAEALYYTACGGNSCRHKDNNKYAPDESCNNGLGVMEGRERPAPGLNAGDLARSCPDAMEFVGPARNDREFVGNVERMRGGFGVSPSAWEEARGAVGPLLAAAVLVYVVQLQLTPAPGADPIKNVGGYYRAMIRLVREGKVNLTDEIARRSR
jgi:replication initiation protein RepC